MWRCFCKETEQHLRPHPLMRNWRNGRRRGRWQPITRIGGTKSGVISTRVGQLIKKLSVGPQVVLLQLGFNSFSLMEPDLRLTAFYQQISALEGKERMMWIVKRERPIPSPIISVFYQRKFFCLFPISSSSGGELGRLRAPPVAIRQCYGDRTLGSGQLSRLRTISRLH